MVEGLEEVRQQPTLLALRQVLEVEDAALPEVRDRLADELTLLERHVLMVATEDDDGDTLVFSIRAALQPVPVSLEVYGAKALPCLRHFLGHHGAEDRFA